MNNTLEEKALFYDPEFRLFDQSKLWNSFRHIPTCPEALYRKFFTTVKYSLWCKYITL